MKLEVCRAAQESVRIEAEQRAVEGEPARPGLCARAAPAPRCARSGAQDRLCRLGFIAADSSRAQSVAPRTVSSRDTEGRRTTSTGSSRARGQLVRAYQSRLLLVQRAFSRMLSAAAGQSATLRARNRADKARGRAASRAGCRGRALLLCRPTGRERTILK